MQFNLAISTRNAHFHDENLPEHIAVQQGIEEILRSARAKVSNDRNILDRTEDNAIVLFDINGNRVGTAWMSDD